MYESEVARIRREIETEMAAMHSGLYGLAYGRARHDFINRRMDRVDTCHTKLATYVGEGAADEMVCELYDNAVSRSSRTV